MKVTFDKLITKVSSNTFKRLKEKYRNVQLGPYLK